MMYALNDFDDTYSVSDLAGAADMSMMSGSIKNQYLNTSGLNAQQQYYLIDYGQRMAPLEPTSKVMREMEANALRGHQRNSTNQDANDEEEDGAVRMATVERRNSNMSLDLPVTPGMRKPVLEDNIFDDNQF